MSEPVAIVRLGFAGDGITGDGRFARFALPGDQVQFRGDGSVESIERLGAGRVEAPCPYFMRCGGCTLQHMERDLYLAFKAESIRTALSHRGFTDVAVEDVRAVAPGTRRRAVLKAIMQDGAVRLGFYEAESRNLIDIDACLLLTPALMRLLKPLRAALTPLLREGETAELHVTETDDGVDMSLRLKRETGIKFSSTLAALAGRLDLARLSWNGELAAQARAPGLRVGAYRVALPMEPFLQPTVEGEHVLQEIVREGVGKAKKVADLFSGLGTFALALADGKRSVHAVDSTEPMIAALRGAKGAHVTAETRDLFRRPLTANELKTFDAVVLDPPRAGAQAQAEQLAASSVPRIVYVSCNPASFARDARVLCHGGYRLERVSPLDQFLWSAHIELTGIFTKPDSRQGKHRP